MAHTTKSIVALIERMAASGNAELASYAQTLRGPRTRGSTTSKGLDEVPETPLVDVTDGVLTTVRWPGCRYLQAILDGIGGRLGAVPYAAVPSERIRRRDGEHGSELYIELAPGEEPTWAWMSHGDDMFTSLTTNLVTVIMGPPQANIPGDWPDGVVYTWHPGEPLNFLPSAGAEPGPWTAVKIERSTPVAPYGVCSKCQTPRVYDLVKGNYCPKCNDWC